MSKSLKSNIAYTVINTFLGLIFPIITFPYISRVLQPEGIGLYNFYNSILGYVAMLANLGITLYATRLIARHRDDLHERSKLTIEVFLLHCLTTLIASLLIVIIATIVPRVYEQQLLFLVMAITIILGPLSINWFYQGIEEFKYITIRSLSIKSLSLVLLFTFVKTQSDIMSYAVISVFFFVGNYVFNIIYLRKFITLNNLRWKDLQIIRHLKPSFLLLTLNIGSGIYTSLSVVLIGFLQSDVAVGYYTIPVRVSQIIVGLITSLGTALLPRFSYLLEVGKEAEFNLLSRKAMQFTIGSTLPVVIGLVLSAESLIVCGFGIEYTPSIYVLQLIAPTILFASIANVVGIQILYPKKQEIMVIYIVLGVAILNIILNFILIPTYSYNGAAVATAISEFTALALLLCLGKRHIEFRSFTTSMWNFIGAVGIMGVLVWGGIQITIGWWQLITAIALGAISYFFTLLWLKNELALNILSLIKNKLKYIL